MKNIITITLIFQLFVSISASANTCTPTVSKGNVLVEIINGDGKTVYSEQHQVRNEKKYSGLISSSKIYKLLKYDKSRKIKVDKSKLNIAAGGTTTKAAKKDKSAIAKIGGCLISEITLFTRLGKQKEPFIHNDVIIAAKNAIGKELKLATQSKPKEKPSPATVAANNSAQTNIQILSKGYTYDPKQTANKSKLELLYKEINDYKTSTITTTCYVPDNSPDLKGIQIGDRDIEVILNTKIPNEFPKNSKWDLENSPHNIIGLVTKDGATSLTAYMNKKNVIKDVSFEHICRNCNINEIENDLKKQLGKPDKEERLGASRYIVWGSKERGYGYSMEFKEKNSRLTIKLLAYCDTETVNKVKKPAAKKPKSAASKLTPTNIKADKDTLIAFGVPLGMPFSPDLVKKINSEAGGKDFGQYYVTPKKAHPYFSSYTINAYKVPINAIYLVRASTGNDFCMDADVCKVKIDAVVNSLNKKYGNPHILKKTTIHGHKTTAHNVPKKVVYKVGKSKIPNRSKEPRYNIELSSSSGRYTIKYADMDVNFSYNKLVEDKHRQKINRASKSVQQDDIDTGL